MKIPHSLIVHSQPQNINIPDNEPKTWISTAEAAALLKIKTSAVINRIKKGTLTGTVSSDLPFTAFSCGFRK